MASVAAVRVLVSDPELAKDLADDELALARGRAVARAVQYPKGPWRVDPDTFQQAGSLGLLVIEGVLVRKVTVGERTCAELLGPGDVLEPWLRLGPDASVATEVNWEVVQPVEVAVLDRGFGARVAQWPEIPAALMRRVMLRVHWLAFHLSVCHMRRVDDRLLLVLWHFADRWGRVTPEGVRLDLALTHQLLASVVGAQRPSVTIAVHNLTTAGWITSRPRSRWVLHGEPPKEFRQLREHAMDHDRPAPDVVADVAVSGESGGRAAADGSRDVVAAPSASVGRELAVDDDGDFGSDSLGEPGDRLGGETDAAV